MPRKDSRTYDEKRSVLSQHPLNDSIPLLMVPKKDVHIPLSKKAIKQMEEEEKYLIAIEQKIKDDPRPEHREAMRTTQCFVRLWRDPESDELCPEVNCDIRTACRQGWEAAIQGYSSVETSYKPRDVYTMTHNLKVYEEAKNNPNISAKDLEKYKKKATVFSQKWVSRGSRVDILALEIWEFFGKPEPLGYAAYISTDPMYRDIAAKAFADKYGYGVVCVWSRQFHSYYLDGYALIRFRASTQEKTNVEINSDLLEYAKELKTFVTENPEIYTGQRGGRLPARMSLHDMDTLNMLFQLLIKIPKLSHLKIK